MIYIIITTSINNKAGVKNDLHRQNRYIESIAQLLKIVCNDLEIKPIIVENNGERNTYLNYFTCDICYTDNNKIDYVHKGENELLDIKAVIDRYNIQDDDIVIKLTGRYKLLSDYFINLVKQNTNHDAFVKFFNVCTKQYMYNDCVLGLFAVRCKYLKEFKYNFIKSPECEFAEYIRKHVIKDKLIEVNQLYLECCFADDLRKLVV